MAKPSKPNPFAKGGMKAAGGAPPFPPKGGKVGAGSAKKGSKSGC